MRIGFGADRRHIPLAGNQIVGDSWVLQHKPAPVRGRDQAGGRTGAVPTVANRRVHKPAGRDRRPGLDFWTLYLPRIYETRRFGHGLQPRGKRSGCSPGIGPHRISALQQLLSGETDRVRVLQGWANDIGRLRRAHLGHRGRHVICGNGVRTKFQVIGDELVSSRAIDRKVCDLLRFR